VDLYDIGFWSFAIWYDCGTAMYGDGCGGWEWTVCFEVCTLPGLTQ